MNKADLSACSVVSLNDVKLSFSVCNMIFFLLTHCQQWQFTYMYTAFCREGQAVRLLTI